MIPEAWRRRGSEVAVVGLGRSGIAATRLLASAGVRVYASDAAERPQHASGLRELGSLPGVQVDLGRHDLERIRRAGAVIVSPGVPPDAPPLATARAAAVPIVSELDLGFAALRGTGCIAVTGTNGKTTTTALAAHLLDAGGVRAAAAGNIGRPLADIALAGERYAWLAVEASSFQLHDSPHFAPDIGVLTNLAPDHLDRYPSVADYYADKRLLFRNATERAVWVLNADDPAVLELARGVQGRHLLFSLRGRADGWYDVASHALRLGDVELLPRHDLRLLGDHNVANALAATLAVHAVGVAPAHLAAGLRSFHALPHRLEPVREVQGVLWINDSKATNIASTMVAVAAMDRPFVLLLGGRHKGEPYTRLAPLLKERCRLVVAYGEAGPLVERDLGNAVPLERGTTFADVVARARRAARPGDTVLLSPACSSFDMFTDYEERGATFRALVERM
ncbi:MAG: UDP-N-acetylmuramoyl-L-alanine--D-glutamate ligase [Gemmatimonadetes bacterium]|nr:MAG: UDP-N-acetylmuramoyl-L-alanine--D-glutamate ligase [Gemmatimonadota bacterium]PYP34402.1 MAG: UDP-N-acetylmuramoyl-L-alanine--D-glutamate ligase [Gemmatimonadota bacterium]